MQLIAFPLFLLTADDQLVRTIIKCVELLLQFRLQVIMTLLQQVLQVVPFDFVIEIVL